MIGELVLMMVTGGSEAFDKSRSPMLWAHKACQDLVDERKAR